MKALSIRQPWAWCIVDPRTAAQGGDEWSIHRRAVRAFVIDNIASVDFRKLDKFWLVELLTSAGPVAARADEGRMAA
ncbi:hypothetical protein [Rhodopseudomonas telluris]|uniref:Uncharacterized protein n=1 Tax=Rhodopseudomonas telluris TaxID=644215 RepID=A0ABV6EZJ5_9BRAD